jgi:aminoglycoside phosphotransferase
MTQLPPNHPLARGLQELLGPEVLPQTPPEAVSWESLPSSRQVWRFTFPAEKFAVVGKFFSSCPPQTPSDLSLAQEYAHYLGAPALGLNHGAGVIPKLLGRLPGLSLGLLLEAVPGPDLDHLLARAITGDAVPALLQALANLAQLLVFFHKRQVPAAPVSPAPALAYFDKLRQQLLAAAILTPEDLQALARERDFWEKRLAAFPDQQVLVHGDATPTNFLFPDGRAVALDLERLRVADRLWDLSWVAGELKHAYGWRGGHPAAAEGPISHFFRAYLAALPAGEALARRLYCLNPFYMALAELRIARNAYLSRAYRRELVAEARRCLAGGRRL